MKSRWLTRSPPLVLHSAQVIYALKHPSKRGWAKLSSLVLEGTFVVAILVLGCC